eukprot:scaffold4547_cov335-Prasinococcus_capsulatus_cf.AAC.4
MRHAWYRKGLPPVLSSPNKSGVHMMDATSPTCGPTVARATMECAQHPDKQFLLLAGIDNRKSK